MSENVLKIEHLQVSFMTDLGEVKAVKDADFTVKQGEIYGLVGESGSGKSVTSRTVLRLEPKNCVIPGGAIWFHDQDLLKMDQKRLRQIRGKKIAMIFQDSLTALNPVYTVGAKMTELIRRIDKCDKNAAKEKALSLFEDVGISDPGRCFNSYPHELSGGMRQRVMIAMALSCEPEIIIADEPTTSLDVTIQAQILKLLKGLAEKRSMGVILITHDLGAVAQVCDKVTVMCGGYTVETGDVGAIFHEPAHPYTKALIASMPVKGKTYQPFLEHDRKNAVPDGLCPYLGRCKYASDRCKEKMAQSQQVGKNHWMRCFGYEEDYE